MATESPHWLIMGKMISPPFLGYFLIRSYLYLQVTRTCIKYRTSWNFGQIGPLTKEVSCLWASKKNSHRLIMGKWCLHASSFIFDQIINKIAGNQYRHKSSDGFDFSSIWFPWPIYMFFWNEIWPWHILLRWAIVALWATCTCSKVFPSQTE